MGSERVVVVRRALDADLRQLLTRGARVTLDLDGLTEVGLPTVDALARLHVTAARSGCRLRLRNVPVPLAELLDLAGLTAVFR